MTRAFLACLLLALVAPAARADDPLPALLHQALEAARAKHHIPGIAALVQAHGVVATDAVGVRAQGHPEPVTVDDEWHIGSDTKAFTATLIARLAERKVFSLDDTLPVLLPDLAARMDPAFRTVTLAQLLSHTGGLPALTDGKDLAAFMEVIRGAGDVRGQRAAVARHFLTRPPATKPGEFVYSNIDYMIAGAIAEAHTGKSWEELVRAEIFAPLGITHAGFGAPGTPGKFDQPHGHRATPNGLVALDPGDPGADNPPALGPAGTIHISLADWARFARDQLEGEHGRGKLLTPADYRRIHTPVSGYYALGWGAAVDKNGVPTQITHNGSNGYWLAEVRIFPAADSLLLVTLNAGGDKAEAALKEIDEALRPPMTGRR